MRSTALFAVCALFMMSFTSRAAYSQSSGAPSDRTEVSIDYASGFRVDDHGTYRLVTVTRPWPGADHELRYLLVRRGTPVPSGYGGIPVIRTPIRSIVALSSTFLAEISELGETSTIQGVQSVSYIYSPEIRRLVRDGTIKTVGEGQSLNVEELIAMQPEIIMASAYGGSDELLARLEQAGLPVVVNGDWAELSPLGRAEWIKFIGLFYGEQRRAAHDFDRVASEYQRLARLAAKADSRPTVFANAPWQGRWDVPGGRSYMARLLADAGASYLWADNSSTGSLSLDFEAVFQRAAAADYWINPGSWRSMAEARSADPRFAQFRAFKEGHLYNSIARTTPDGGNDYWESGPAHPELVLADLIRIFHPNLLPGRALYYFERLR